MLFDTMIQNTGSLSQKLLDKYRTFGQEQVAPIDSWPGLTILSDDLISMQKMPDPSRGAATRVWEIVL